MKFILPYLKKYKKDIVWACLTISLAAIASLWQPKLLQQVVQAIADDKMGQISSLGVELIVIALVGLVAGALNTMFAARIAMGVAADIRLNEYQKIQQFSYGNIEQFSAGNLVVRLTNDVQQVQNMVMAIFQTVLRIPIIFIGAMVLALMTLPNLWWVILVMVILVIAISAGVFKPMGKFFGKIQGLIDKTNNLAKENLQGARVVKSFNQSEQEAKRFNVAADSLNTINIKIGYLFGLLMPAFMLVGQLAIAVSVWYVGSHVVADPKMLGGLTSFVNYLMQIMIAIVNGGFMMTFAARAFVSVGRIEEVMQTQPDLTFKKDAPAVKLAGSVAFKEVGFTYPGDSQEVLHDISFSVDPGEMIGIVGATGSGKSTVAQLIARLFDPSKGSVEIGGVDLRVVNEQSLRQAVAYVQQRAMLFSGTIADNLRQGKRDAKLADMRKAGSIAQAAEFIEKYPDSYEHQVEERSANFSGGQKQRLSIARGVIGQPAILILDDSTSALDAQSEKRVQEALATDLPRTTKFIIAEKISSVIKADRIFVMADGHLVAEGSHHALLKTSPIYQEIYNTQKAQEVDVDD